MNVDTGQFEAITGQLAALAQRVEQATTVEAILRRANAPVLPFPARAARAPRHARPRRDRHGLQLIRGGGAAGR